METNNRNSQRYGLGAITLHWLIALAVIGLFSSGVWMVSLDYYSPWYNLAPDLHKAVGLILLPILLARIFWPFVKRPPQTEPQMPAWERNLARTTHHTLNLLTFIVILVGYFMLSGLEKVDMFSLFSLPLPAPMIDRQADLAGFAHKYLAWALIILAGLHALAALKHHFIDKRPTLARMLPKFSPLLDNNNRDR